MKTISSIIASIIEGRVWRFGKNIDTDLIIAARYLNTTDEAILASHLLEDARSDFASVVKKGDIIVADENFGCGSSREHAPIAIKAAGISVVIAPYFARIFYRNAFNTGLLALELKDVSKIKESDILNINIESGIIINKSTNETYTFNPIPTFMLKLLSAGGLMQYAKQN
ncbi:3-isopropylmalate dehydratase small subunit [Helicobacter sp. MIT 14-3879]|uniref:3-isopropylmalate dehydratase small subunit n=1 Tax=Helicobacter sp. MIT 14-3879 TaxID=2040649 RepID=UPI000E1E8EA2|nr:3-isopropylmalate dehydratase small subunit [Helicobacter sp. MIT 14-3879]RDU63984.1 3-isopropylmalate dehydratase [Helicobacter sp. MIT 14-3879]